MDRLTSRQQRILIVALLAAATMAVFWPLTTHEFISYDDAIYITGNAHVKPGLTGEGVAWAFTTGEGGNWHPLTWLSHMLDAQLFGMRAGWHHLVSLVLHAINAVLLFLLLDRLTRAAWRSAFVAALFALHPLHVQSVAWAAERKDVLSAFLFLLTLLAYTRYVAAVQRPDANTKSLRFSAAFFYSLSLLFLALGLMSKPMLVTVPFVLLLLDWWPLRRFPSPLPPGGKPLIALLVEKIPFLLLAIVSCVVTMWAQRGGGAVVPMGVLSFGGRLANALAAGVDYLRQTFWPSDLALLYPFDEIPGAGALVVCGAIVLAVTARVVWNFRKRPWLAVGWFWFLGMLVPVIGIVQVGMQQRADRYTYLPLIGLFILFTWEISERLGTAGWARNVLGAGAALILAACIAVTRAQIGYWQDSEHIFRRAVEVNPSNYIALNNYGLALLKSGRAEEAIPPLEKAVALHPELDAARAALGSALMEQKKYGEAAAQFKCALELRPDNIGARLQLGIVLGRQGKLPEAAEAFAEALRRNPDDASAHNNFGNVLMLQGKYAEALKQFEEAVRLRPDYGLAYNNLATCCKKQGRIAEAIGYYRQALRLQPNSFEALNNLAWILAAQPDARFRDGTEAVQLAVRAGELTQYRSPAVLATLAAAFAESGRFQEAVSYAELARKLVAGSQNPLAARLDDMLTAFRAGQAYHAE